MFKQQRDINPASVAYVKIIPLDMKAFLCFFYCENVTIFNGCDIQFKRVISRTKFLSVYSRKRSEGAECVLAEGTRNSFSMHLSE